MAFTLFVILPNDDVCTLRNVTSGTTIRGVRKQLELAAGLPAQTYRLVTQTGSQSHVLHEDHVLRLDSNVWDGFVLRAVFLDSWQQLYDRLVANDVSHVIQHGAVSAHGDVTWASPEEASRAREVIEERGVVALFVASFLGMLDMCRALLTIGVSSNGKTPFGRTPLFAAMSRDHDHVMELLLSHQASLELCDADGASAVDVGRRLAAKQCMRKVRHLQAKAGNPRPPTQGLDRSKVGRRVIRIPSGQRENPPATPSGRPPALRLYQPDNSADGQAAASRDGEPASVERVQQQGRFRQPPQPHAVRHSGRDGEGLCQGDIHQGRTSRAPNAAGTQVRAPSTSSASRSGSRGVTWGGSTSVPRMLPLRQSVFDISAETAGKGAHYVLTSVSTTSSSVSSYTARSLEAPQGVARAKALRPAPSQAILKYFNAGHALPHPPLPVVGGDNQTGHASSREDEAHAPAQEPPGRPPTRTDQQGARQEGEEERQLRHRDSSVGTVSFLGSQGDLSVGSAPEFAPRGGDTDLGAGLQGAELGDSDDDGGRVLSSRSKSLNTASQRQRRRLLESRQRQQESWRAMKRRLKLAEEQRRSGAGSATPQAQGPVERKETYERWLERKRRERQRNASSSEEESADEEGHAANTRSENSQAFGDWLKDLKDRPLRRPHTSTPAALHRRKSRPLKDVIQVGASTDGTVPAADPASYLTAYREWQHRYLTNASPPQQPAGNANEKQRQLEEKRKEMLAMALTYDDWLEHAEERKKLMQAILRADLDHLQQLEHEVFRSHRAPRQISFAQWREKVEKKETEIRHQRQRMRKEAELQQREGEVRREEVQGRVRPSLAASHKSDQPPSEHQNADSWAEWQTQKQREVVAQWDQHLSQERQLLLNSRHKKSFTVSQC